MGIEGIRLERRNGRRKYRERQLELENILGVVGKPRVVETPKIP